MMLMKKGRAANILFGNTKQARGAASVLGGA